MTAGQAFRKREHSGYCESYLGARPLQPLIQIATSILRGIDDRAADADATLQALLKARGDQPLPGPGAPSCVGPALPSRERRETPT